MLLLWSLLGLVGTHEQRLWQLEQETQVLVVYFLFALPGWLIALPFVILLKDAQKWRGWVTLLIGTCIGPSFILIWSLIASSGHFNWRAQGDGLGLPLMISLPATVCYVLALKFAHRRRLAPEP
jgi:hypothetical protein